MRTLLPVLLLAATGLAQEKEISCATHCHGKEAKAFSECVHAGQLSCVTCHGGDATAQRDEKKAHSKDAGFVGTPARAAIPQLCGNCHSDALRMHAFALPTDQLAHYRTSGHGKALAKGDEKVAVCSDCHSAHLIRPAHDPRSPTARRNQPATCGKCHADATLMKRYDLPADIVLRFEEGVHGRELAAGARGAPACADCHGAHGASPPGVDAIVHVCGQCHTATAENFAKSAHGQVDAVQCTTCHEAHDTKLPGPELYDGCLECHESDQPVKDLIATIGEGRRRLEDAIAATRATIREAKEDGVFLEHEQVYVRESERALVLLQPLVHSLDRAAIQRHLENGLGRQERTREELSKQRKVLRDRKILLSGLSLLLLVLAWLFWTKLKAIRRLS